MGLEIERKFLLKNDAWRLAEDGAPRQGVLYRQGYISRHPHCVVRLRLEGDERAFLTIKGRTRGFSRSEYQYEIPAGDCSAMLSELAERPLIVKTRYNIVYQGMIWSIDEFHGENSGLFLAEIELESETQNFAVPPWLGEEVSGDARYANARLVSHPFSRW